MAVLTSDPHPECTIALENPSVLQRGDRLDALDGKPFANISAFDTDGDGKIDFAELVDAIQSANLGEMYASRPGSVDIEGKSDEAIASLILDEFDTDGSGELNGAEVSAFLQMVLDSVVTKIAVAPRPIKMNFSRSPEKTPNQKVSDESGLLSPAELEHNEALERDERLRRQRSANDTKGMFYRVLRNFLCDILFHVRTTYVSTCTKCYYYYYCLHYV